MEGIVGKLSQAPYIGQPSPWIKVLNPSATPKVGRHEVIGARRRNGGGRREPECLPCLRTTISCGRNGNPSLSQVSSVTRSFITAGSLSFAFTVELLEGVK